ncbi:MAG TPA: 30S ribosome-binding factor RbfA [Atopobiaceae bacterium]|nr:30S ribosome-binding factor RbfA [Atopobiaceae bacterium]
MKQNQNSRRINQIAQEKLGYILLFELSDPELELVTLTSVEVSTDKSVCRAYISCEKERYERVSAALERAKGRIRSLLGRSLGWRVTPKLTFFIDTTADEAETIAHVLKNVPPTLDIPKDEEGYPLEQADGDGGKRQ